MESHKPPFPKWYDLNGLYDYHYGAQDHTIENYLPLKYKVQSLIKEDLLDFNRNNERNVTANPLPNHIGPTISSITKDSGINIKTKVDEIKRSMDEVYHMMMKIGVIPKKEISTNEKRCCFCHTASTDNIIRECKDFKNLLQANDGLRGD